MPTGAFVYTAPAGTTPPAGGITRITSADESIAVTNPTGPTTDLSVVVPLVSAQLMMSTPFNVPADGNPHDPPAAFTIVDHTTPPNGATIASYLAPRGGAAPDKSDILTKRYGFYSMQLDVQINSFPAGSWLQPHVGVFYFDWNNYFSECWGRIQSVAGLIARTSLTIPTWAFETNEGWSMEFFAVGGTVQVSRLIATITYYGKWNGLGP